MWIAVIDRNKVVQKSTRLDLPKYVSDSDVMRQMSEHTIQSGEPSTGRAASDADQTIMKKPSSKKSLNLQKKKSAPQKKVIPEIIQEENEDEN